MVPPTGVRAPASSQLNRPFDERQSVSSVSTSPLPPEFSHPSLQELLRQGSASGSVPAATLRTACEDAQVPMKRMKAVLRALEAAEVAEVVAREARATRQADQRRPLPHRRDPDSTAADGDLTDHARD